LRAADAATGGVVVGPGSAAAATSSALPLIHVAVAHDGRCPAARH
jgi:hypothetical protein